MISAFLRRTLAMIAVVALAACGGGSERAPDSGGALAPPGGDITIAAFTPQQGGAGTQVTVSGTGFAAVQSARIGGATASFTVLSATELRLTVPAAAQTGRIELAGNGRSALSGADFTVTAVPAVTAVAPAAIVAPGRIVASGSHLDRVTQARLGATALAIAAQSAASLSLDVPAGAPSAFLTLVDGAGVARQSAVQVTVAPRMTISSLAPASIVAGQTLTINGTNLNRAQSVEFANGAIAPVASRTAGSATVVVPAAAASGPVTVVGDLNDRVTSSGSLTLVPPIVVTNPTVHAVSAGATVTLAGSGFIQVGAVLVGTTAATITSRSDTQIAFTVPAGVNCGLIQLQSASQPPVAGGSVVVGGGCTARIAGIEFAQVLSQPVSDAYHRLVPGKRTMVRAYVVSPTAGNAAPTVRLTGFSGGTELGTLTMTGPAALPQLDVASPVPDSLRYDEARSYNAVLPDAWVTAGLRVVVEVDPEQRYGAPVTAQAMPNVGTQTRLDLVVVPLVSGAFAPVLPAAQDIRAELIRRLPIPAERITVQVRAPYTLTSVMDGLDTEGEWTAALSELNQLRIAEAPSRNYYGFVRRSGGGIAGIGYVGAPASLGWDSASGWRRTMTHELGHNFGRRHAPCGAVAGPDPNYPYAGGVMSTTPLFDSLNDDILAPVGTANATDIMGYCGGAWFSDYNYRAAQQYLEMRPQTVPALQTDEAEVDLIAVSGTLGLDGLTLAPVRAARGVARVAEAGEYMLRLRTESGAEIEVPFDAFEVDHAMPPQKHFHVVVPHPGRLSRLDVLRGAAVVPLRAGEQVTAQARPARDAGPAFVDWQEADGLLRVRWNADAHPHLAVTLVRDGERSVLSLGARGGAAVIDLTGVAAGGHFEFSLSDGLNAQVVRGAR